MDNLQLVPMNKQRDPPTAVHHLKICPGQITTVHEHKEEVMFGPNPASDILSITQILTPLGAPST